MGWRCGVATVLAYYRLCAVLMMLTCLLESAAAASILSIFNSSTNYIYHGCWTETTELANTTQQRALDGDGLDAQLQLPGTMAVSLCLDHCARNAASSSFAYAGLEYSRECWCADDLSPLSTRLPDAECDTPCDGDVTTACGGALRLSVYELQRDQAGSAPGSIPLSSAMYWVVGSVSVAVGLNGLSYYLT